MFPVFGLTIVAHAGLILADSANMAMRIGYSWFFIKFTVPSLGITTWAPSRVSCTAAAIAAVSLGEVTYPSSQPLSTLTVNMIHACWSEICATITMSGACRKWCLYICRKCCAAALYWYVPLGSYIVNISQHLVLHAGVTKATLIDQHVSHKAAQDLFAKDAALHVGCGCGALLAVLVAMFLAERDLRADVQQLLSHSRLHED